MYINRDAPESGIASLLALQGTKGDTELVHMTAEELSGLHSMGELTYNPITGLPEAFKLGSIFKAVTSLPRTIVKGVKKVAFDKGKYKYHGRIKTFAETLRKNGLKF